MPLSKSTLMDHINNIQFGDHLCIIYEHEWEHKTILTPYLKDGLLKKEKVIYINEEHEADIIKQYLTEVGMEVEAYLQTGQLEILSSRETYLTEDRFNPDHMIEMIKSIYSQAIKEGYTGLRISGEMSWFFHNKPGSDRIIEYEAKLNDFFDAHKASAICQYNKTRFQSKLLLDVIKTHPYVILGTEFFENFYYIPTKHFFKNEVDDYILRNWINNLKENQKFINQIKEKENKYKTISELTSDHIFELKIHDDGNVELIYVDKEVIRLFDQPLEQLKNVENWSNYFSQADYQKVTVFFYDRIKTGQPGKIESCIKINENEKQWINIYAMPKWDDQKQRIVGFIGAVKNVTDRKIAEEKLKESEARARTLLNSPFDAIFLTDRNGILLDGNETVLQKLKVSREGFINRYFYDLLPEEVAAKRKMHFEKAIETGESVRFEDYRNQYWYDNLFIPIKDSNGTIVQIIGIGHDITERKNHEVLIKQERSRMNRVLSSLKTGLSLINPDMTIEWVSDEIIKMFPYQNPMGKKCYEFYENRETLCDNCGTAEAFKTGEIHKVERYNTVDKKWYSILSQPLKDDNNNVVNVIEAISDITEKKSAMDKLRQNELALTISQEIANLGSFDWDLKNNQLDWSRNMYLLAGLDPDRFTGNVQATFQELIHPEDRKYFKDQLQKMIAAKRTWPLEYRLIQPEGQVVQVKMDAKWFFDEEGNIEKCIGVHYDLTSLKQMQNKLLESEQRYKELFERSRDGFVFVDINGRFIDGNAAYCDMLQYTIEELKGKKDFYEITPESWREWERKEIWEKRLIKEGYSGVYEKEYIRKDGTIFPVELQSYTVYDEKGSPLYLWGIARDITERKKAEQVIIENEKLFRTIIETSPGLLIITDEEGKAKYISPNCFQFLGYTQDELIGQFNWWVHPEDIARAKIDFGKTFKTASGERNKEYKFIKKDGSIWYGLASWDPVIDHSNHLKGIVLQIMDITDRRIAEQELRKNEELLRGIIDADPSCIFLKDKNGKFILVNKRMADIHHTTPDGMIGKTDAYYLQNSMMTKEELDNFRKDDLEVINANQPKLVLEEHYTSSNNELIYFQTNKIPFFIKGIGNCVLGIAVDITAKKLAEIQLKEALEKATRSDRLKSAFLANMSHEIRTPLNGILGFVELLEDHEDSTEEIKQHLHYIKDSGKHLLNLINDILELSKIEAGETKILNKPFSLFDELSKIHLSSNMIIVQQKKNIDFNLKYDKNISTYIQGDPVRLRQILNNLISNAIKFTPQGSITLEAKLAPSNKIELTVSDSGIGIAEDKITEIFKPFVQEDYKTGDQYGGTGLGLSISKKLVELMQGQIMLSSTKGEGSQFSFTIPYIPAEKISQSDSISKQKSHSSVKHLILIAEDDPTNQILITKMLSKLGYNYVLAKNGEEAINKYRNHPNIDLILMDIRMPDLDGIKATQIIKSIQKIEQKKSIPIIALTAAAMPEDIEKGKEAGFDAYLTKPVDKHELLAAIHNYLGL